jgi:hypothetical protein
MIGFRQFLGESAEARSAFVSAKKIAPYIKSDKYRELFLTALDDLTAATDAKEVYNARFSEHKMRLSRGIEYAYNTLFNKIRDDVIKSGQETIDLWSITTTADINKVAKIYDKMSPRNREASEFVDAIRGIPDALKTMKSYVKSGKPPREPKPGQFIKPMASLEASRLAVRFMTEAVDSFEKRLRADVSEGIQKAYDKIRDMTDPNDLPKTPNEKVVAATIFVVKRKDGKKVLELIPNPQQRLDKLIDNNVRDIVDGFISKNASKLALILQKKGTPKAHSIDRTNIRNGMVENTMNFTFNDGSAFTLESSVVYKYSPMGKLFFQYPTRFRDVRMADGSRMKTPSEEKMIREF